MEKTGINEKYTQKQVLRLLSKCAKRRCVKKTNEWVNCARLKYIDELAQILGV